MTATSPIEAPTLGPPRGRRRRVGGVVFGVAGLGAALLTACNPVSISGSTDLTVSSSNKVSFSFACSGDATCRGNARLRVAGLDSAAVTYGIAAGKTGAISLTLTSAQLAKVPAGTTKKAATVRVTETAPRAIATRDENVTLSRAAAPTTTTTTTAPTTTTTTPPVAAPLSVAYRERNWTPTSYDTCSAAFHASFSVIGPDGKRYPTWHPPTAVDPSTGQTCTFGHEHGDDPSTSNIYTWVTDFLDATPSTSRGIPFGYVSEALDTYAANSSTVTRHEDNVGHKIIVANNVKLVAQSPRGYVRDAAGNVISCDVLIKVHQGSHSGDAIINNAHELLYAAKCSDGTGIISSTMSTFGNANEFNRSCDNTLVTTAGSNLPAGDGGERRIPDRTCIDRNVLVPTGQQSSIWALYEVWESANELTTADGSTLASFDPWFGVRNPARAHAGGVNNSILDLVDVSDLTDPADNGRTSGYPFDEVTEWEYLCGEQMVKQNPASPFDGAERDYYLKSTTVTNTGGATTWFTTPWGRDGQTTATPGYVRQYVSATDNSAWPELERRSFNLEKDYGGNGVHAPN
jgi:hypothetical protein